MSFSCNRNNATTTASSASSSSYSSSYYTVNASNYKDGVPKNVVNIIVNSDINQSLYKEIFRRGVFGEFYTGTTQLINVILPHSLKEIEDNAFCYRIVFDRYEIIGCDMIQSITIPPNVTKIGKDAFAHCKNLESISLPQSLKEIDPWAFQHTKIKDIFIPDSVTILGKYAFANCFSLESVKLSKSLTYIADGTFQDCCMLQSIIIPDSVSTIRNDAFQGCQQLQSVTLPHTLCEIKDGAFYNCNSLISINIPNSVSNIGADSFQRCYNLQNISIPKKCTVGRYAFNDCTCINQVTNEKIICENDQHDWLKNRFDSLPIHQLCYNDTISLYQLEEISIDDTSLHLLDVMCMTPLHVLSCNPHANLPMIQTLTSKCPIAVHVNNRIGHNPVDMYLVSKAIVSYKPIQDQDHLHDSNLNEDDMDDDREERRSYNECEKITHLLHRGSGCNIHALIRSDLTYKLIEILLAFKGTSIDIELGKSHNVTLLYPFITAALSSNRSLGFLYKLAMLNPTVIKKY